MRTTVRRLVRSRTVAGVGTGVLALLAATVSATTTAGPAAAEDVPCSPNGSTYTCQFWPQGDGISAGAPVVDGNGARVGYLNNGSNYIYCQQTGKRQTTASGTNIYWAWTDANDGQSGWVNAVYARGGDNDAGYQGVPACDGSHGNPPQANPNAPCPSDPGAGDAVHRWDPVTKCVLGMLGQPQSDELIADTDIIIRYESSGDPSAINLWDSNAQNGTPSTGLVQVIQPTFDAYKSPDLADDIWDPAANIYAGLNYGIHRYGSIQQIPGVASVNAGGPYKPYFLPPSPFAATTGTSLVGPLR